MAQSLSSLTPLLERLVAPLGPEERAILLEALKQPEEFMVQLRLALRQASESPR